MEITVGFEALKKMTIQQIIDLEKACQEENDDTQRHKG